MTENENILDMHKLMPAQFRAIDRERALAVVPFAPIEYHGDHLPLGTDYIFAGEVMRSACTKFAESHPGWKFLMLPVFPMGADTVPHGGSLSVHRDLIRDTATQITAGLIDNGFRYIALFTGHGGYGQMLALEEVARDMQKKKVRNRKALVFSPLTHLLQKTNSQEFIDRVNSALENPLDDEDLKRFIYESHGGRVETSYILSVAPELMNDAYKTAPPNEPPIDPYINTILSAVGAVLPAESRDDRKRGIRTLAAAMTWFFSGAKMGYLGAPSLATPEFGLAIRGAINHYLVELIEDVLISGKLPKAGDEFLLALRLLAR